MVPQLISQEALYAGTPALNVDYVLKGVGPQEVDPFELSAVCWPDDKWASYQKRIIYSVWNNKETTVKAGNKLGKDYMAGFICVVGFLTRHPCRIVTTSAKEDHLRVLWGEIGERIRRSQIPLEFKKDKKKGVLIVKHNEIQKMVNGERCSISYIRGMVAGDDSIGSMQGHHVKNLGDGIWRSMFMCDEASHVNHEYYRMARSWFDRAYIFGNPWPCSNFFQQAFRGQPNTQDRGGDILRDPSAPEKGYYRKVFTIRATDSPNVQRGLLEEQHGITPSDKVIIPGLLTYSGYQESKKHWDAIQRTVSLDGDFYEGRELRMFPQDWMNHAAILARKFGIIHPGTGDRRHTARGIGVDSAAGGDKTAIAACDECGILEIQAFRTPDTNVICPLVEAFVKKWKCSWDRVFFDIGGGGKQHADRLRARGRNVRTIVFNAAPTDDIDLLHTYPSDRKRSQDIRERRQTYKNRRAEMYGNLRELLDPALVMLPQAQRNEAFKAICGSGMPTMPFYGFSIPNGAVDEPFQSVDALAELHRQMYPIPLTYNEEGIIYLLPKHPRPGVSADQRSLTALIGCSPDELDAAVLAVHAMLRPVDAPMYL